MISMIRTEALSRRIAPVPTSGFRLAVARDGEALEALAGPWTALWRRIPGATPFQHPAWLIPWWRAFAHGDLWVIAVYHRVRLVAVLPLYREEDRLLPLGVGITDLSDILAEPEVRLADLLAAVPERTGCATVEFPALAPWSPLLGLTVPDGWREMAAVTDVCPVLPLARGGVSVETALPPEAARNLRHTRRRAERAGGVAVESATSDSAGGMLEDLIRLHTARWTARGQPGVLSDPAVLAFHRAAVPTLAKAGLLRMFRLRIGGRVAAVHYGLGDGRRAYHYRGGFEPELASVGPGALATGHAIADALREGAEEFHFLRGREPYKRRWGARESPSVTRRFWCGDPP